jgi:predicted kinase
MPALIITRGLPGSGKSTWAQAVVRAGAGEFTRVNRDDVRRDVFGAPGKAVFDRAGEQAVTAAQQAMARALLAAGRSVIVDDTNLRLRFARQWADLAHGMGAQFVVEDRFLDVPLMQCIAQDAGRPDGVGADVIREMHAKFLAGGQALPAVTPTDGAAPPVRPYARPQEGTLPMAWLVDIDGTLSLLGGRGPFEWTRVSEDTPNEPVVAIVHALAVAGYQIVLMSGRDEECREATSYWLAKHGIPFDALHMRPAGDSRKDAVVKAELFDKHVRDAYDVVGVIDDRAQVVAMWRAMGLTVAQVDEGRF